MLLATLGTVMLGAASHHLFTQVAVMVLARPTEYVIVIIHLFFFFTKDNISSISIVSHTLFFATKESIKTTPIETGLIGTRY